MVRILLTCRLGATNQHDLAACLARCDDIDLYVLTDSATYPEVPELDRDRIYHYHPTWPVIFSRFHPYDKRRYREFLDEIDPDALLSTAVSHLAFMGPTVDFHPTVFLPQGGKVNSATRQRCKERGFGIRWVMYRPMMWDLLRNVDEVWTAGPNREILERLGFLADGRFVDFDWGVVDTERFYPRDDAVSFVSDPETVVIGSFRRARNPPLIPSYETFLDAVALLADRRDDFHIVIGGLYDRKVGPEVQRAIDDKIDEHGLSDIVTKLEMVPKAEMPRHYSGLDVYVNFSPVNSLGGIGTASKEAMACGCAFATFNDPPAEYVVDDWENGILLEHDEPVDVANRLNRLVAEPALRESLAARARETALDAFGCESVSEQVSKRCGALAGEQ